MNRRQFLKRAALTTTALAVLPSLLPHCKECGAQLLIELLSGETDLCASCRSKHITLWPLGLMDVMVTNSYHGEPDQMIVSRSVVEDYRKALNYYSKAADNRGVAMTTDGGCEVTSYAAYLDQRNDIASRLRWSI